MVPWGTFERSGFAITSGQLAEHRSSPNVSRGFCARCGTSLTYRHEARGNEIDITLATLDDADELAPESHIWVQDKLRWMPPHPSLPKFASVAGRERMAEPTTAPSAAPPGLQTLMPRIFAVDAAGFLAFLASVFEARSDQVAGGPTLVRIAESVLLVSDASSTRSPTSLFSYVYVQDVDATFQRALAAGARSLEDPTAMPYGDRRCMVEDRWGNVWQIATTQPKAPPSEQPAS